MHEPSHSEQAAFYRTTLFLGLVRGEAVVRWADDVLAGSAEAPAAFVELATIPVDDLTALRLALLHLCDEHASLDVVQAVLGLIGRQLASGRRSLLDTMTVLRQMRGSVRLAPELADELRELEVAFWRSQNSGDTESLASLVHEWFERYRGANAPFARTDP